MYFPFFILRHGGKRPAAQPQTIYSEIPKKKRLLPQHSVCDKSLKRTHGIGHSCRDDAAMQQPPARNAGRLPFTPFHQGEYIKLQRNCKAFFGADAVFLQSAAIRRKAIRFGGGRGIPLFGRGSPG